MEKICYFQRIDGIQLWGKDIRKQIDFYQIHQLPYCVLVDPEGKIIKAGKPGPVTTALLEQVEVGKK